MGQGVCGSPDGRYVVTGTSQEKAAKGQSYLKIYDTDDFSLAKSLDFGERSVISVAWQKDINQLCVGTSKGEAVMLYSPFSSKRGALHFVGRHRRARAAHEIEEKGIGAVFPMVEGSDIAHFYKVAHGPLRYGNLDALRRTEQREKQKTILPQKPDEINKKTATTSGTKLVSSVILNLEGKSKIGEQNSQKELLKYANKEGEEGKNDKKNQIYMTGYNETQPVNILDYSVDESEGDQKMHLAM